MLLRERIGNWLQKTGSILSAGRPAAPAQPEARPILYAYPRGVNTNRALSAPGAISPQILRALADGCDLLRLAIETRKDQIGRTAWEIRGRNGSYADPVLVKSVHDLLQFPDGLSSWDDWLRALVEDLLVIDAVAIFVDRSIDGQVRGFEAIDAATIKPIVTDRGTGPTGDNPAFQQLVNGQIYANFTRRELVFRHRNRRTWRQYGLSPVAQVHRTVQHAILSSAAQVEYLTEGNVPHTIFTVPTSWTATQIAEFQAYWDTIGADGKTRAQFVPGGITAIDTRPGGGSVDSAANEWLARVICYALSVSPGALVRDNNRATAEQAAESALSEGLAPLLAWVKSLIDELIQAHLGARNLEFAWLFEQSQRPLERAQLHAIYLSNGVLTIDEVRADLGLPALDESADDALSEPQNQLPRLVS